MTDLPTGYHALSRASFAAIAAGRVDPATANQLSSAQLSIEYLLTTQALRAVAETERDRIWSAVTVLSEAQRRSARSTSRVWRAAWSCLWAGQCLAALGSPGYEQHMVRARLFRFGATAAAVALHAGLDAQTWTMTERGRVVVPTLGMAQLPAVDDGWVSLEVRAGRLTIRGGGQAITPPTHGWQEMRRLHAAEGSSRIELVFDDLDPLRDCYGTPSAPRVTEARMALWRERFAEAWSLLSRCAPQRAEELKHTMGVLVPLLDRSDSGETSATSADAPGALAMSLPRDAASFAVALVHEQAHSTLNCLLNLVPLYARHDASRYFAPWRPDPRPIGALLHGSYAFLAVADTWLALATQPGVRRAAQLEFALRRAQLESALATLASAEALTSAGRDFVSIMCGRLDDLMAHPVALDATIRARQIVASQQADWQARHRQR